jgi:hypothetical protein
MKRKGSQSPSAESAKTHVVGESVAASLLALLVLVIDITATLSTTAVR